MVRPIALIATGLLAAAPTVTAQVQETKLTRPDARYEEPMSSITGLRALPDGRVLVSDGIDETLLRINLKTGKTDTVGRTGQGPGEYKVPDGIFALENNQTLLVDLGNGRLSVFDLSGKYLESMPIARGQPGLGMTMLIPRGTDSQGRIYFQPGRGPDGRSDSTGVVRFDRKTEKMDTVAMVGLAETKITRSGSGNNRSVNMSAVPLSPADAWAVAPDGRIAIARAADYHLEWIAPDGKVTKGPAVTFRPVPIREAEKQEWMAQRGNGLMVMVENNNGAMNVRFGRGGGARMRGQDASQYEWPQSKPAFTGQGVSISAEGEAWVERSVPAGSPREYDVFGTDARLKRRVVLPKDRSVIGFAPGMVYVQYTDPDDELKYLEAYRIP